jgi:enediyne biosynthesis protein E4
MIRAVDPAHGQRDAYGAEVSVRAGGRQWKRTVQPGYSFLVSNDPRVHFGLGSAAQIDQIEVIWPDGTKESFPGVASDRFLILRKGSAAKP